MDRTLLPEFGLTLAAACGVLLAVVYLAGHAYLDFLVPLYRWEIGWLAGDWRIIDFRLAQLHGEQVYNLSLQQVRYLVVGSRLLPPEGSVSSSTLAGQALQQAVIYLGLVFAWPADGIAYRILRTVAGVPLLLLAGMLDVPLVLIGSVDDLIYANLAPGSNTFYMTWMNFMNGGGRFAVAVAAALCSVALYPGKAIEPRRKQRNSDT
ncbi:MAG: hypothetical protein ACYC05_13560 [Sulfuricella sp.]